MSEPVYDDSAVAEAVAEVERAYLQCRHEPRTMRRKGRFKEASVAKQTLLETRRTLRSFGRNVPNPK